MNKTIVACLLAISSTSMMWAQPDPPELSSWLRNTNGRVGYNNIPADVQQVRYSANYVYVNSTGIPAYTIGPWPGNPNTPTNQNFVFKIARFPVVNTGTKTRTSLGVIAVWRNGVAVFNALDAFSYNNQNIWHRNAVVAEAPTFDACLGHPAPGGTYHHHQNPRCVHTADSTQHSPIVGYAFDGYPIYGPYGYTNTNGTGGITRMQSSYRLRSITQRRTLPDGTVLPPSQYGPDVSGTYPLGIYVEDFEYVSGLGSLDQYNGRFAVTPEYPAGTYAYVVTINANGSSAYPYVIGPEYNGVVVTENITTGGHVTVTEPVTVYDPSTDVSSSNETPDRFILRQNYPNPFNPATTIPFGLASRSFVSLTVFDALGREVAHLGSGEFSAGEHIHLWEAGGVAGGVYMYRLVVRPSDGGGGSFTETRKLVVLR